MIELLSNPSGKNQENTRPTAPKEGDDLILHGLAYEDGAIQGVEAFNAKLGDLKSALRVLHDNSESAYGVVSRVGLKLKSGSQAR